MRLEVSSNPGCEQGLRREGGGQRQKTTQPGRVSLCVGRRGELMEISKDPSGCCAENGTRGWGRGRSGK